MNRDLITLFEHESIRFDKGEKRITEAQFHALENYFGEKGVPYFSLIRNGVQFNEYVGVIQIGKTVIEVLPKADKDDIDAKKWRNILIGMLKVVGNFDIKSTSESNLKINPNTILDLYFELFIKEVEYLFRNGLVKKYHKKEGNLLSLKGSLQFSKHIQLNITHQERFYVRHTTYDTEHQLHFIIYKTICLLKQINTNATLSSRIGSLILDFPEMPDIKVSDSTFSKLSFNRKTEIYKKAIEISKLILLKYHPDISKGNNNVLALMFDMNKLWEQFVCKSLQNKNNGIFKVSKQSSKYFWKPVNGDRRKIRPDIYINKDDLNYIIDTKWKIIDSKPSVEDIRQMYAYHHYFKAQKVALLYPGKNSDTLGSFVDIENQNMNSQLICGLMFINVNNNINNWQIEIVEKVNDWIEN